MIRVVALLAPASNRTTDSLDSRCGSASTSGLVVVGDVGSGQHHERLAPRRDTEHCRVGAGPLPHPDTVVISAAGLPPPVFNRNSTPRILVSIHSRAARRRCDCTACSSREAPRDIAPGVPQRLFTPLIGREEEPAAVAGTVAASPRRRRPGRGAERRRWHGQITPHTDAQGRDGP